MKLYDLVTTIPFISHKYEILLRKLSIETVHDLLTYFPRTYKDAADMHDITDMLLDPNREEVWQFNVSIVSFKDIRLRGGGRTLQQVKITDGTGTITVTFFNQPYLKNVFKIDEQFIIRVKATVKRNKVNYTGVDYEQLKADGRETVHTGRIVPEYKLTEGISRKWFRNRMHYVVKELENKAFAIPNELEDLIPDSKLEESLQTIHFPESAEQYERSEKLLSLYELTNLQLKLHKKRVENKQKSVTIKLDTKKKYIEEFVKTLPFKLTQDQITVLENLTKKLIDKEYLNDLVQGDVGSGKTVIAMYLAYVFILHGFQVVFLAPTTVLAEQHYKSFISIFSHLQIDIELVIGSIKRNIDNAHIVIGTTAVLARRKKLLTNVGIVIADEQQRFGVNQREELLENLHIDSKPHFVQLTATPIPRTIAETFFGDITVHTIKTKPKGRLPIQTRVVPKEKRENMISWIKERIISEKQQAFWICPLIEGEEKKSVTHVYNEIKDQIKPLKSAMLHGKMKSDEKRKIMQQFLQREFDILISTTVIEVGIDVPNATIMVIDDAENFGLAQLHQIRGRVGRNDKESWCFILQGDEITEDIEERLNFFSTHNDGLEIAEYDLMRRGPGEVYGTKQSGIPNLKIAKLNDIELIKQSKKVAEKLYSNGVREIKLFN